MAISRIALREGQATLPQGGRGKGTEKRGGGEKKNLGGPRRWSVTLI